MIFIISRNTEESTNRVIKWLLAEHVLFERINFSDFFSNPESFSLEITGSGRKLILQDKVYTEQELQKSVIWFRKLERFISKDDYNLLTKSYPGVLKHLNQEFEAFIQSFVSFFYDGYWLCHYNMRKLNKTFVLIQAQQCGLKVPDTIISNNRKTIQTFPKTKKITKCMGNGLTIEFPDHKRYLLSTNMIKGRQINSLPEYFFPSTLQSYIDKSVELRIFFIDNHFFASAIFSQESEVTKIDFRLNVIDSLPCRMVPYTLPVSIKAKLKKLMRRIGLNTGSIDMIVSPNNEYYFLEVNPFGQYGWVADLCNYPIDKTIASFLKRKHDERQNR